MIVDTSGLLAYLDAAEPAHAAVAAAIERTDEPLVISPYVLAELDYLVLARHGMQAEQAALAELGGGAWELAPIDADRFAACLAVVRAYADVPIGLTDASTIVLADAYRAPGITPSIVTLDRRHFSILRLPDGSAPQILP